MPNFPKKAVVTLKNWLYEHIDNPYPTDKEKAVLSKESGLSKRQIQNWFTNARKVRLAYKASFIFPIEDMVAYCPRSGNR